MLRCRRFILGLCLCLGLLGLAVAYSTGRLHFGMVDSAVPPSTVADNHELWEQLAQHPGPPPVWHCPSHPQHSWGVTVGGNYVGLDVFTEHSVVWMSGNDLRLPFVVSPQRLWMSVLLVGSMVGTLLVYIGFRSRRVTACRPSTD